MDLYLVYTDRVWNHVQPRSPLLRLSFSCEVERGNKRWGTSSSRPASATQLGPHAAGWCTGGNAVLHCCAVLLSLLLLLGAVERTGKKDKLLTKMSRKAPLGPDRDLVLHFLEKKKAVDN